MKSRYVFIVTAVVLLAAVGLFALISSNPAAPSGNDTQQSISASSCPFTQPAAQQLQGVCCKSKSDPNGKCEPGSKNSGCKKKSDPNCTK